MNEVKVRLKDLYIFSFVFGFGFDFGSEDVCHASWIVMGEYNSNV